MLGATKCSDGQTDIVETLIGFSFAFKWNSKNENEFVNFVKNLKIVLISLKLNLGYMN